MAFRKEKDIVKRIKELQKKLDKAKPKTNEHGIWDNAVAHLSKFINGTFKSDRDVQYIIDRMEISKSSYFKEIENYELEYDEIVLAMEVSQQVNAPPKKKFERLDEIYDESIAQIKWGANFE